MATVYVSSFPCSNDVCVFYRPDILEQASSCGTTLIFSYCINFTAKLHDKQQSHPHHNVDTSVPAHHDARASVRQVLLRAAAARTVHILYPAPARRARLARHALHCPHRHVQHRQIRIFVHI